MQTGIYGVAISGLITQATNKKKIIKQLKNNLHGNIIV